MQNKRFPLFTENKATQIIRINSAIFSFDTRKTLPGITTKPLPFSQVMLVQVYLRK